MPEKDQDQNPERSGQAPSQVDYWRQMRSQQASPAAPKRTASSGSQLSYWQSAGKPDASAGAGAAEDAELRETVEAQARARAEARIQEQQQRRARKQAEAELRAQVEAQAAARNAQRIQSQTLARPQSPQQAQPEGEKRARTKPVTQAAGGKQQRVSAEAQSVRKGSGKRQPSQRSRASSQAPAQSRSKAQDRPGSRPVAASAKDSGALPRRQSAAVQKRSRQDAPAQEQKARPEEEQQQASQGQPEIQAAAKERPKAQGQGPAETQNQAHDRAEEREAAEAQQRAEARARARAESKALIQKQASQEARRRLGLPPEDEEQPPEDEKRPSSQDFRTRQSSRPLPRQRGTSGRPSVAASREAQEQRQRMRQQSAQARRNKAQAAKQSAQQRVSGQKPGKDVKVSSPKRGGLKVLAALVCVALVAVLGWGAFNHFKGSTENRAIGDLGSTTASYSWDNLQLNGDRLSYVVNGQKDSREGVDVSEAQGNVNWGRVAGDQIDFAYIRCGYRGTNSGDLITDQYFKKNMSGASHAGLDVGVYYYSQATTEDEAREEADTLLKLIEGYDLQLPIGYYLGITEGGSGRADKLSNEEANAIATAFCSTIEAAGHPVIIYGKPNDLARYNNDLLDKYGRWYAEYTRTPAANSGFYIWQYTNNGTVAGIDGPVDLDINIFAS